MSDKYQSFTQSPLGKILVKNLGLPAPTPEPGAGRAASTRFAQGK